MSPLTNPLVTEAPTTTKGEIPKIITGETIKPKLIEVSLLIDHPDNVKLNPPEDNEEEYQHLKEQIKRQWIENRKHGNDYGNTDAITVYKNNNMIEAGHYRTRAHRELGIRYIKFEWADRLYDPNADSLTHFENLESSNSSAKRNESKPNRAVKKWELYKKYYYERHGEYPTAKSKEFKDFCDKRQIQYAHMSKYLKYNIFDKNNKTDILDQVTNGKMSMTKADSAMKEDVPKGEYDPNRHNFFETLKNNPKILEFAIDQTKDQMKHYVDYEYDGIKILLDDNVGTEMSQLTGLLSNVFNSAIVHAFRKSGLPKLSDCVTPRKQQKYFDAQFPSLSKIGFLLERLEVKAGRYGKSIADTKVTGGAGGFGVKPHEYFILVHDNDFKQMFIMLATLEAKDWKGQGKVTTLDLGTWWEKYKDQTDKYMFILGKIRKSNKTPQIVFEDFLA